jgi:signal transduction histidine kinase/FixJ family two-component response regulator
VARYVGDDRARAAFAEFAAARRLPPAANADMSALRFAEHQLASAVGAASSRLILRLLLERHSPNRRVTMRLLDDASAAIQHNRDLLQSAIDHVPQGLAFFDNRLTLTNWNRQFIDLFGFSSEAVSVGMSLQHLLEAIAVRAAGADPIAAEVALRRIAFTHETYQQRLADPLRVVEVRSTLLPDGGVAASFADVTEQAVAADALEARVKERTAELEKVNRELARAKAVAEEANQGKTRFIAAASHDILQPLNAARLFASTLVERTARNRNARLARDLDSSLESVEEILTALLDISRLDAGTFKPDIAPFPLAELLETLRHEHEPTARRKGLKLRAVTSRATVLSDRRLIRRVLQNFLSNAIKYTDAGKVVMGCRRRGSSLVVEVHDSGRGIAADQLSRIFREFERLDAHRSTVPGLGLGLSIVDRIAHLLDHPVEVRSVPARGSVFSITLPCVRVGERASAGRPRIVKHGLAVAGRRVAVVDNDPAVLEAMTSLLEGWGCIVTATDSVRSTLDAIAREPVDVLLADYHLGDGDGLALITAVRKKSKRRISSLLITADRSPRLQRRAERAGVICLRKPIKPAALRAAMSHLLSRVPDRPARATRSRAKTAAATQPSPT